MAQPVLLDNVEHHDLRIITRHGPEYGDATNQTLVVPTEYEALQREYPIFFRQNREGGFESFVLLGFDNNENLFLDGDVWQARYIPAILTRGPFMIGFRGDAADSDGRREPVIHVDLDHPRVSHSEGEPLFLTHGGNAPALERTANALRALHVGAEMSAAMFAAFIAAGLIAPVDIKIRLDERTEYDLPGLFSISAEALAGLDGPALAKLHAEGFLALAFHVVSSTGNINRLIEIKTRRRALA